MFDFFMIDIWKENHILGTPERLDRLGDAVWGIVEVFAIMCLSILKSDGIPVCLQQLPKYSSVGDRTSLTSQGLDSEDHCA